MVGMREGCCHRLCGAAQQGIDSIDIKVEMILDIGCNTATCEPADILELVLQPREIIQVLQT